MIVIGAVSGWLSECCPWATPGIFSAVSPRLTTGLISDAAVRLQLVLALCARLRGDAASACCGVGGRRSKPRLYRTDREPIASTLVHAAVVEADGCVVQVGVSEFEGLGFSDFVFGNHFGQGLR